MKTRTRRGFTLIEMMVVITIIAVLAGGVALFLFGHVGEARTAKAKADLVQLDEALSYYRIKKGSYPDSLEELAKPIEGQEEPLVKGGKIPKDPWGNEYVYQKLDKGFELKCLGADGAEGGEGENADILPYEEGEEE